MRLLITNRGALNVVLIATFFLISSFSVDVLAQHQESASSNTNATKKPCTDYPSCQLISPQMFESYCNRSTLKNMCPTYCDAKCFGAQKQKQGELKKLDDSAAVSSSSSEEVNNYSSSKTSTVPVTTTTTTQKITSTTTMTTAAATNPSTSSKDTKTVRPAKNKTPKTTRKNGSKQKTKNPLKTNPKSNKPNQAAAVTTQKSKITTTTTTTTTASASVSTSTVELKTNEQKKLEIASTANNTLNSTKPTGQIANVTIYVPLFEAGFVQRVIPTTNKQECDFTKAMVCKQDNCDKNAVWCPMTNDIPKEQLEILFNYTTDIYMLETQGRVYSNETVTHFLFQYLNDAGVLMSQIFKTETRSSSKINKFMFDPPLRTNYIRITPIEFEGSIAMRFEVYSKGILYNPANVIE